MCTQYPPLAAMVLRERSIHPETGQLLMARIGGSSQEGDLTEPPNCEGYGRIRHFRMETPSGWPANPLPIQPAAYRLNLPVERVMNAQVFQNAACNWRCWYCYAPFNLLAANENHAGWLSATQLVDLYLAEKHRPILIDCSGGQPDLIPEWVPQMMAELRRRGLADSVYLWSDDNLSNDFFWRYLPPAQRREVAGYRNYGRVCCFKGFNADSFTFNTKADQRRAVGGRAGGSPRHTDYIPPLHAVRPPAPARPTRSQHHCPRHAGEPRGQPAPSHDRYRYASGPTSPPGRRRSHR